MTIEELAEEAVATAEFQKAYNVRKYAGSLLSELKTIPSDSKIGDERVKARLKSMKLNSANVIYNRFAKLDVNGNFEFEEFMEAVKKEME